MSGERLSKEEYLQRRLLYAGFSVPIDVIKTWADNEKAWAEMYADNILVSKTYGWLSTSPPLPMCLRPFLKMQDQDYDGHGIAD